MVLRSRCAALRRPYLRRREQPGVMQENAHMDASGWNERYAASTVWSGEPNAALVTALSELLDPAPGQAGDAAPTALDIGCGEGADARWLAAHGWAVTGVDWSDVALDRARSAMAEAGLDAMLVQGDATDADFLAGLSPTGAFDLVSLAYIHPEPEDRDSAYAHLPALVAPGGHLLVIAHDPEHGERGFRGPPPARLMSPQAILGALHLPADFEELVAQVQPRERDGEVVALDSVVLVRRAD
jgi:SAM-dependent methyltransferase